MPVSCRTACGEPTRALALYEWNSQVSAAFQRDLSHVEVALRNAYDGAAAGHWTGSGHWLLDDYTSVFAPVMRTKRDRRGATHRTDINAKPRSLIASAIDKAGGPRRATDGKVAAELSFGFWRYLSSSAHEKTLWVPMLHHAFPARTNRAAVDAEVGVCTTCATASPTTSRFSARTSPPDTPTVLLSRHAFIRNSPTTGRPEPDPGAGGGTAVAVRPPGCPSGVGDAQ